MAGDVQELRPEINREIGIWLAAARAARQLRLIRRRRLAVVRAAGHNRTIPGEDD